MSWQHGRGAADAAGRQAVCSLRRRQPQLKFAREQRREPTQSEERLWQHLRRHGLGLPFRRQHPIGEFVLDFYCAPARLAVEIDGPAHEQQREYDQWRDAELAERGIRMLRIGDDQVRQDINTVLEMIRTELAKA